MQDTSIPKSCCTICAVKIKRRGSFGAESYRAGATFSIMPQGIEPFRQDRINHQLAGLFLDKSKYLEPDNLAFNGAFIRGELPILQYFE